MIVYSFSIFTWQHFIASNAFLWLCGVTPAQHEASTIIGTSGKNAFVIITFEITQISVHNPTNVISSIG